MPIFYRHVEQNSGAWDWLRATIPTASDIEKIITPTGRASTQALAYMNQKLSAWMLGRPPEAVPYQSRWMEHGHENEDGAIDAFEFQSGLKTSKVGFVTTDDGMLGASPDRLVGDISWLNEKPLGCIATLEIKSPSPPVQTGYLLADSQLLHLLEQSFEKKARRKKGDPEPDEMESLLGDLSRNLNLFNQASVESDYHMQCQTQLLVLELDKSYVSAHNPDTPSLVGEFGRDERIIKMISAGVQMFNEIMLERRLQLEQRFGPFVRPEPMVTKPEWGEEFHVSEDDVDRIVREVMEEG